jgi:hypothetical protein
MEISIFLAKLLGPYCIIVAIGIMFNLKTYQKVMEDFFKNSALVYLGGIIALFFGLLMVSFHNIWMAHWAVIITIFGWLGVIKGTWLIILPNTVAKLTKAYQRNTAMLVIHLVVVLILGIFLTVKGYGGVCLLLG